MTRAQSRTLHLIEDEPGLATTEISKRLGQSGNTTMKAVNHLERIGRIERRPGEPRFGPASPQPHSTRSMVIEISGRRLHERVPRHLLTQVRGVPTRPSSKGLDEMTDDTPTSTPYNIRRTTSPQR